MRIKATANPQGLLMLHLSAIMQRMKPSLEEWGKDGKIRADDLINLFSGTTGGLVISGRYDGQIERGSAFLPFNYERAISLIRQIRATMQEDHANQAGETDE